MTFAFFFSDPASLLSFNPYILITPSLPLRQVMFNPQSSSSHSHPPSIQPPPKMSSRPRQFRPIDARSPPLTTSPDLNTPQYTSQHESLLPSTDGSHLKLKIKSATTPEARSRLNVKPLVSRLLPISSHSASRALHRAITPSDSEGSLVDTIVAPPSFTTRIDSYDHLEEHTGETETVLVTVRLVL